MKVRNHRLIGDDNRQVAQEKTPNGSGKLVGGKPRFLVIHYTAGGTASGAVSWFKNPAAKASAHLVIGHDGEITQMQPFDDVCWHAGKSRWRGVSGLNRHSVGIEIVNWGVLKRSGADGWASSVGTAIPASRVILDAHKNHPGVERGWEIYDEPQMQATIAAAQAIVQAYDIAPMDVVGHDDISPARKVDPGPAFDFEAFRAKVAGRGDDDDDLDLFRVRSSDGLNLRTEPSIQGGLIKTLPDGAVVSLIERDGKWRLVAEVVDGIEGKTGFVHGAWLEPM